MSEADSKVTSNKTEEQIVHTTKESFSNSFISALEIKIDGIDDLQTGQEQNLESLQKQNIDLLSLKADLEDITLIFSKLPEYQEKLDNLKRELNLVTRKGAEVRDRAKEVERLKYQRKLADEKLLAQPSTTIGTNKF